MAVANIKNADSSTSNLLIIENDPYLEPHQGFFDDMHRRILETEARITNESMSLSEFARGHEYFGLHFDGKQWIFREWAPNATAIYLKGTFNNWSKSEDFRLESIGDGKWEIKLEADALHHEDLYRLHVEWWGGVGDRIPAYARSCVQDHHSNIYSGRIWEPGQPYKWKMPNYSPKKGEPFFIYETHVGMALEEAKVGSYKEFAEQVLPRIVDAGYNTLQLMGILEHPYYGSFGYQVANYFAPSFRYGNPDELKELIDTAHEAGLSVFLDLVHSHAVKNELEGLSCFDGTYYQYFHDGARGEHPVWDSRLFNYGKSEVLHFLLSNVRYWVEEFRFDGLRFDGVTAMLYYDHGLGDPFTSYDRYFGPNTDKDALTYLSLANKVAHAVKQDVVTIAEDVSGMPGLASSEEAGGFGFDYRLALGIPDLWIKCLKTKQDEDWHVENIFHELSNRRKDEKTISYAESHDQALVGDKTLIFWLLDSHMYWNMSIDRKDHLIERGLSLHCMMRLSTLAAAGHGYLNFMGNEFGHPEWIDFPREGNGWSYHYARRQWSLRDDPFLQYHRLADFDKAMLELVKKYRIFDYPWPLQHYAHVDDQVLVFSRGPLLFIFNFNPAQSFCDYPIYAPAGEYRHALCTDDDQFGGAGRIHHDAKYFTFPVKEADGETGSKMQIYITNRTGLVLENVNFKQ